MSDNETVNEEGMFLNPLAWMTLVVRVAHGFHLTYLTLAG